MKNLIQEIPTGEQSILLVKDIARSGTNRNITDEQLAEMTESVRTHGVIQPLVVRPIACVDRRKVAESRRPRQSRSRSRGTALAFRA